MTRTQIAFASADISALARSLKEQLTSLGETPSHVQMLNMLARAAGRRNFQDFRAGTKPADAEPAEPVDEKRVSRAAGYFDKTGRLVSWPAKTNLQELCLWVMWARLPARRSFGEREISALIDQWHLFGDRALLRREMVDHKMVQRTQDGSDYRRIEQVPPADARELLRVVGR